MRSSGHLRLCVATFVGLIRNGVVTVDVRLRVALMRVPVQAQGCVPLVLSLASIAHSALLGRLLDFIQRALVFRLHYQQLLLIDQLLIEDVVQSAFGELFSWWQLQHSVLAMDGLLFMSFLEKCLFLPLVVIRDANRVEAVGLDEFNRCDLLGLDFFGLKAIFMAVMVSIVSYSDEKRPFSPRSMTMI